MTGKLVVNNKKNIAIEYSKFTPFYQSVGKARNHFDTQFVLLKNFINKNDKQTILDASCATGDVLNKLIVEYPQSEFYGSDLCESFLNLAKKKLLTDTNNIKQVDWLELSKYFKKDIFDLVYILGNSIFHCQSFYEFEKVVFEIRKILKKTGKFVFDLRDWEFNKKDNSFNEPYLGKTIHVKKGKIQFTYLAKYCFKDNKHILIHNIKDNFRELEINLPFLNISVKKIVEILKKSGFCKIKTTKDFNKYPFILVTAENANNH